MSRTYFLSLLIAGLLWGGPAFADELPDCIDPQFQVEMTYCAGVDYEKADNELNALWPEVAAAAKERDEYVAEQAKSMGVPTTFEALLTAQRAWLKFRDAECEYQSYSFFGGTGQSMAGSLCLAQITQERIYQLRQALEER